MRRRHEAPGYGPLLPPARHRRCQATMRANKVITEQIALHPGVTHAELTSILLGIMQQWNKYAIRDERDEDGK